jgi:cytochrome c biogenesis factor
VPLLGQLALWLAFMLAVWGALIGFAGARTGRPDLQESARRATIALAAALLVALVALVIAVVRRDFRVAYVADHADRAMPPCAVPGAVLDGVAGRLLLGVTVLAACLALARATTPDGPPRALAHVIGLAGAAAAAVLAVLLWAWPPFAFLSYTPLDGQGLEPRLQDAMAQLSVALRCGAYGAAAIPIAWLLAGRMAGAQDENWRRAARTWALAAWALVSADVGLSLWLALREVRADWLAAALWRPALPLWLGLTIVLHGGRRSGSGLATHVAHVGAVALAVSLASATFDTTAAVRLRPGESAPAGPYALTYLASSVYPGENAIVTQALLELRRNGRLLGRVGTVRRQQLDMFGQERFAPSVQPAVWSWWRETVLVRWDADSLGGAADFRVAIVPLAPWVWVGWWLAGLGGVAAVWRRRGPS